MKFQLLVWPVAVFAALVQSVLCSVNEPVIQPQDDPSDDLPSTFLLGTPHEVAEFLDIDTTKQQQYCTTLEGGEQFEVLVISNAGTSRLFSGILKDGHLLFKASVPWGDMDHCLDLYSKDGRRSRSIGIVKNNVVYKAALPIINNVHADVFERSLYTIPDNFKYVNGKCGRPDGDKVRGSGSRCDFQITCVIHIRGVTNATTNNGTIEHNQEDRLVEMVFRDETEHEGFDFEYLNIAQSRQVLSAVNATSFSLDYLALAPHRTSKDPDYYIPIGGLCTYHLHYRHCDASNKCSEELLFRPYSAAGLSSSWRPRYGSIPLDDQEATWGILNEQVAIYELYTRIRDAATDPQWDPETEDRFSIVNKGRGENSTEVLYSFNPPNGNSVIPPDGNNYQVGSQAGRIIFESRLIVPMQLTNPSQSLIIAIWYNCFDYVDQFDVECPRDIAQRVYAEQIKLPASSTWSATTEVQDVQVVTSNRYIASIIFFIAHNRLFVQQYSMSNLDKLIFRPATQPPAIEKPIPNVPFGLTLEEFFIGLSVFTLLVSLVIMLGFRKYKVLKWRFKLAFLPLQYDHHFYFSTEYKLCSKQEFEDAATDTNDHLRKYGRFRSMLNWHVSSTQSTHDLTIPQDTLDAIDRSAIVVFVLSPGYLSNVFALMEISYAIRTGKPVAMISTFDEFPKDMLSEMIHQCGREVYLSNNQAIMAVSGQSVAVTIPRRSRWKFSTRKALSLLSPWTWLAGPRKVKTLIPVGSLDQRGHQGILLKDQHSFRETVDDMIYTIICAHLVTKLKDFAFRDERTHKPTNVTVDRLLSRYTGNWKSLRYRTYLAARIAEGGVLSAKRKPRARGSVTA